MKSWKVCDNCNKELDNNFSNYCNDCRKIYNENVKAERERTKEENNKFWEGRK